jgi:hypothetical protein
MSRNDAKASGATLRMSLRENPQAPHGAVPARAAEGPRHGGARGNRRGLYWIVFVSERRRRRVHEKISAARIERGAVRRSTREWRASLALSTHVVRP